MRVLLEILRIILIFGLLGGVGWALIENIYTGNQQIEKYSWLGGIALFVLLFVLYRNKWHFSGWYHGKGRVKLSRPVTLALVVISVFLFSVPFVISVF
ncbi:hypothetical protein [Gracilibacillus xinjiangensis]|uniref:Uncharacterized protein n=1 Tax=Gracilibacillus xinjiangensis TaxID=1193282 RepID=A0ABV8WV45_9BACI